MPKRRATYTGELARPIPYIQPPSERGGLLAHIGNPDAAARALDDARKRYIDECATARVNKLPALFRHYGVEEGDFLGLASALAIAHVPGFSMAKGRAGGPKSWSEFDVALLRLHIDEVRAKHPRHSELKAADMVARSGLWNAKTRGTPTGATLKRRAACADDRYAQLLRASYRYWSEGQSPPSVTTIEEFVREWVPPQSRLGK